MNNNIKKNKELKILINILVFIVIFIVLGSTYAIFNYTRTGSSNSIKTGPLQFSYADGNLVTLGNAFPATSDDVDNVLSKSISITAHTTLSAGIRYNIYITYGDTVSGKTRFRDDVISFQFYPANNVTGFTTTLNNCSSVCSLTFNNGKALVASGLVKDTVSLSTQNYVLKMWIDSSKMSISSTTKRANNLEGNPSLADTTSGTTTAGRYMNNGNVLETVTLYPAISPEQTNKIIYTTKEFANSYYSYKIVVEAEDGSA